jgi:hypothetical protein
MTIEQTEAVNNLDAALEKIWALCKDSSVTVDSFLEMRRRDKELEENQYLQFFSGFVNISPGSVTNTTAPLI